LVKNRFGGRYLLTKKYWLMKTEPDAFSIDDLKRKRCEHWDGIRNYQSRNFLRDELKKGDGILIYHSNAKPTGVAGVAKVSKEGYPDHTAWDPDSKYFDPKSDPENPTWFMVDVEFVEKFPEVLTLQDLKENPNLEGMMVTKRGMRLSIQPVEKKHFEEVCRMGKKTGR